MRLPSGVMFPRASWRVVAACLVSVSVSAAVLAGCGGNPMTRLLADQHERGRLATLRGEVLVRGERADAPLVVALLRVPEHTQASLQIVDYQILRNAGPYSFFAPAGRYRVIAFEDRNRDQRYDPDEPLGAWDGFADVLAEEGSAHTLRIEVTGGAPGPLPMVQMPTGQTRSLHIGDVVALEDPRFAAATGVQGMWEPLAFMETLGGGLFLVEPHVPGRVPVVLVHGMTGYPQEFRHVVGALDRERFEPWLVQYPSGWELSAVADYLARALVELSETLRVDRLCVVAHSMGGVVSRRTLRVLEERGQPELVRGLVTLASPLGGIPSASAGVRFSPVHVPSWASLVPDGEFMMSQYTRPLSTHTDYTLFFAFDGRSAGDGVVPLTSQLRAEAQREAAHVQGFHTSHVGILEDDGALAAIGDALTRCLSR